MPVSFNNFPDNWRLPLYWVEIDPSQAGLPTTRQPVLLVGQKLAAGRAVADVPIPIGTLAQAQDQFGVGSMLERMFAIFLRNNFAHEMWALPVNEPSSGAAATGTITLTHAPTEAGTLHLYIAGQHVAVGVDASDAVEDVAVSIVSEINALATLPVTAAHVSGASTVTLTCKWKGSTGNDIDVRDSYFGTLGGEALPVGLALTYPANNKLAGGSGAPSFDTAIANLADEPYEYVAVPFTDSTSLLAWDTEFGFEDTGRWGWMRQMFGTLYSAYRASYANMITYGATNNFGPLSIMGVEVASPSPIWEWSAAYCAKAARALLNDPARPLQTLTLAGVKVAPKHQRFSKSELNNIAGAGIATQQPSYNQDGSPMIMRDTTTYQLNLYGFGDDAYELLTTMATLSRLIRDQRQAITSKFPRHKLADDGTRFGPGQAIVTPKIIKAELVAEYRIAEFNGLVENMPAFKANLLVERDNTNPNRVRVLYPPDLINQLRIFSVLAQFRLQYDRGVDLAVA